VTAGVNELKEGVTAGLYKLETFYNLFFSDWVRSRSATKCYMNSIVDFCRFLGGNVMTI